jgi:hypothetical protein
MQSRLSILVATGVLALAGLLAVPAADAQTNGMDRRGERRDNRQGARDEKQECKAGDEKSRPECRQDKREGKQEGRGDEDTPADGSEAAKPEGEKAE